MSSPITFILEKYLMNAFSCQMLKMRKKVHEEAVSTDGSKWADHCVR